MDIPSAPLERVLERVASVWSPLAAPMILVFGQTGSGKSTLVRALLGLVEQERVALFDPKPAHDVIWDGPPDDPAAVGQASHDPVPDVRLRRRARRRAAPMLVPADRITRPGRHLEALQGQPGERGGRRAPRGVPRGLPRAMPPATLRRAGRQPPQPRPLGEHVRHRDSRRDRLGGGPRSQAGIVLVGATSGLEAAKAGAALLGHSGRAWYEATAAVQPHEFLYVDNQPGCPRPGSILRIQSPRRRAGRREG